MPTRPPPALDPGRINIPAGEASLYGQFCPVAMARSSWSAPQLLTFAKE